jgi:hypothetical protein
VTYRDLTLAERALSLWKVAGPGRAATSVARFLFWRLSCVRLRLDVRDFVALENRPAQLEVRRGVLAELEAFRRKRSDLPIDFFIDRFHPTRWFYLGFWEGELAHVSWISAGDDNWRLIRLGPSEVEVRFVFTLPAYRRRGIQKHAIGDILADLKRTAIEVVYAHVVPPNVASYKAFTASGFRAVAMLKVWRLAGIPLRFVRAAIPPAVLRSLGADA